MPRTHLTKAHQALQSFRKHLEPPLYARAEQLLTEMVQETDVEEALSGHVYCRIFPLVAIYRAALETASDRETARRQIFELYHQEKAYPAARFLRRMMKIPRLHRLLPKLAARSIRSHYKSSPNGFRHEEIEVSRGVYRVNILRCPYYDYCSLYDVPELADAFCITDEICYGSIHPNIAFERRSTLARGADQCDFCFRVIDSQTT